MSHAVSHPALAAAEPSDDLARRTAHGFVWLMVQTMGAKAVGMAGQVILAWLLIPRDFGLWGMATVVISFAGLIQQAGLREILIYRQTQYHRWANPAFWMSLMLGCVGALVTAAAAWPAAWFFKNPQGFIGLVLVLAAAMPIASLDLVAEARLQIQLRFGLLATVNWMVALVQLALSVIFAKMGLGAYSFVLPRPILALGRLAILWSLARPPVRWSPQVRRWRYLMTDSALLLVSNIFLMLQWNGDYLILGRFFDERVVGIYFFAFNLSIQTMQLFTGNLTGVLFPALSKLQDDPVRQIRGFLDATRLLALAAVPLCFLQMALADAGIRLLFQDAKWQDAIPVLQALSVGMAFRVVASPGGSLIQAQGRFLVTLLVNIINALVFLSLVTAGALAGRCGQGLWLAPATTVGIAVALYFALIGPAFLHVAIKPNGGTWHDVWRVYAAPLACSILAVAPAMALSRLIPVDRIRGHHWGQSARVVAVLAWSVAFYVPLVKLAAPAAWNSLIERFATLFRGNAARAHAMDLGQ